MPGSLAVRLSPPVWVACARDTCNATSLHRRPVILCDESFPAPRLRPGRGLGKGFLTGHPFLSLGAPTQPARQDGREGKWGDWGANKLQKLALSVWPAFVPKLEAVFWRLTT